MCTTWETRSTNEILHGIFTQPINALQDLNREIRLKSYTHSYTEQEMQTWYVIKMRVLALRLEQDSLMVSQHLSYGESCSKAEQDISGLDGRQLQMRSAHSALNTLLQGAGAIVMKKALVILDEWHRGTSWTITL